MAIASIIIKAIDEASKVFKQMEQSGKQALDNIKQGFDSLKNAGTQLTTLGVVGSAAFGKILSEGAKFKDVLTDTMSMTGLSGKEYDKMEVKLGSLAKSMSNAFGVDAKEIVKSYYQVLSTGVEAGSKGFKALAEAAIQLNKVTGLDTAKAVETLGDTLKIFGMKAEEAGKVADVFFKASMLGSTTVPQMSEAMREGGKAAASLKIPIETTAAILLAFANKGVKGAEAGTVLRMVLTRLAKPTKEGAEALKQLGINVYDSQGKMRPILTIFKEMQKGLRGMSQEQQMAALKAIAGEEAFAKFAGVMDSNLTEVDGWAQKLKEGGSLQEAFNKKINNAAGQFAKLRVQIQNIVSDLGENLLPLMQPIIDKVMEMAKSIGEFVKKNPELSTQALYWGGIGSAIAALGGSLIIIVGQIGGAVTSIISSIGLIKGALTGFFAFLAANPIGATIAAIVLVIAGLYLTWKNNLFGMQDILNNVATWIKGKWDILVAGMIKVWNDVWIALEPLITKIRDFITYEIGGLWERRLKEPLTKLWAEIQKLWNTIWGWIAPKLDTGLRWIYSMFLWLVNTAVTPVLSKFFDWFKAAWDIFVYVVTTWIIPGMTKVVKTINTFLDDLKYIWKDAVEAWEKYIKSPFLNFLAFIEEKSTPIINAIKNLFDNIYQVMQAALEKITTWFNSKWKPIYDMIIKTGDAIAVLGGAMTPENAGATGPGYDNGPDSTWGQRNSITRQFFSSPAARAGSSVVLNVGTLIADESGLRSLEKILHRFSLERQAGMAA